MYTAQALSYNCELHSASEEYLKIPSAAESDTATLDITYDGSGSDVVINHPKFIITHPDKTSHTGTGVYVTYLSLGTEFHNVVSYNSRKPWGLGVTGGAILVKQNQVNTYFSFGFVSGLSSQYQSSGSPTTRDNYGAINIFSRINPNDQLPIARFICTRVNDDHFWIETEFFKNASINTFANTASTLTPLKLQGQSKTTKFEPAIKVIPGEKTGKVIFEEKTGFKDKEETIKDEDTKKE
ncbi:MAG: hypothetical protein K0R14_87 [Burkholderiales bacterium]|jgi:hypothetical protein|nr:hypothetical protein [Burkholderiales bacterium]